MVTRLRLRLGPVLAWTWGAASPSHYRKKSYRLGLRGRGLLSHETEGFQDRGFSGSLSWQQQPDSDHRTTLEGWRPAATATATTT